MIVVGGQREAQSDIAAVEQEDADNPDLDSIAGAASADDLDLATGRPVYRYSVIPGGAYDAHELAEAIDRDPVVAGAYRTVAAKDRTAL